MLHPPAFSIFFSPPNLKTIRETYHLLTCPYPPYQEPFADGQSCDAVFLTFTETRLGNRGTCLNSQKTRRSFDPARLALGPWVREYRNNPNSSLDEATYQCLRHGSCGGKSAGGSVVTNKEVVRPLICPFRSECNSPKAW